MLPMDSHKTMVCAGTTAGFAQRKMMIGEGVKNNLRRDLPGARSPKEKSRTSEELIIEIPAIAESSQWQ